MRAHIAKERLAVRVAIFKIVRDRPGIGDDLVAVDQDRNPPLAGKGNDILLGKAPRDRLDLEFLMGERHLDAPAIGAEPSFIVGRRQIVECAGHVRVVSLRPCHGHRYRLRRLAKKQLLPLLGDRGPTRKWLALGIGALRGRAAAHRIEPAA